MDSKLRALLEAAIAKTESGGLSWEAFDSVSFRAKVGGSYLHVQQWLGELDERESSVVGLRYTVQVSNRTGQVVADADAHEAEADADFPLLARLYTVARTSALGGYRVIDEMLQVLSVLP